VEFIKVEELGLGVTQVEGKLTKASPNDLCLRAHISHLDVKLEILCESPHMPRDTYSISLYLCFISSEH
jgi:hypothetical protein